MGGNVRRAYADELSDGLIVVRCYQPGIESAVLEAARESLAAISPYMRTWRDGATYAKAARHVSESVQAWQAGTWYDFAIGRVDSNTFLGRVGLDRIDREERTANVGYWVRTGCTRQGIATAAVRLVAQFAFEDLDLQQIEFVIASDNLASRRVAEKASRYCILQHLAARPSMDTMMTTATCSCCAARTPAHLSEPEARPVPGRRPIPVVVLEPLR